MSNIDKLLYIDGLGEITQNLNIGGNLNVTNNINIGRTILYNGEIIGGSSSSISATNFKVGTSTVIDASKRISCTAFEVKNQGNIGLLADGQLGTLEISGTLSVDTISEKTSNGGVTIHSPIITGTNNDVNRIIIKDSNLSNNIYIQVPNITSDINLTLPNQGGTLATESYVNNQGFLTSSSLISSLIAGSNITLTNSNGNITIASSGGGGGSSVWTQQTNNDISYTNGNIGFGTANPTRRIHVQGDGEANGWPDSRILIESTGVAGTNAPVLELKYGNPIGSIWYDGSSFHYDAPWGGNSDDRIKDNEALIVNSINTILKLRPQTYMKKKGIMYINEINNNTETEFESGLIAQEVYYEVPELRHLVSVPSDAILIDDNKYRNFADISNDPDYNNWGNEVAGLNYTGLIPYLIKGIQEQQEEINTLKQENTELKSIIDKLKTANSFEEFKNSL